MERNFHFPFNLLSIAINSLSLVSGASSDAIFGDVVMIAAPTWFQLARLSVLNAALTWRQIDRATVESGELDGRQRNATFPRKPCIDRWRQTAEMA